MLFFVKEIIKIILKIRGHLLPVDTYFPQSGMVSRKYFPDDRSFYRIQLTQYNWIPNLQLILPILIAISGENVAKLL